MNEYEQYSFASAYKHVMNQIKEQLNAIPDTDKARWLKVADQFKSDATKAWDFHKSIGGIAGEGGRAGSTALALISLRASAKAYSIAEAKTLQTAISRFEAKNMKLMAELETHNDWMPTD